jgi:hypothetical protein
LTISPLVGGQLAGLVDDRVGDADLADVVQQRAELEVALVAGVEADACADVECEGDDAARVLAAGVRVVGHEQLAHEQRGAAVGVAELDRVLDALLALPAEDGQQPDERHEHEQRQHAARGRDRGQEADRREGDVDEDAEAEDAHLQVRRDAGAEPLAQRRDDDVDDDLRGERQQVQPPQVEVRTGAARGCEHHRGTDDVPRVAEREQRVVRVHAPGHVGGHPVEQRRHDDREHGDPRRQREQHDDEHRLGGTGGTTADAELHAPGGHVGEDPGGEVQRSRQRRAGRDGEAGDREDEREPDGRRDHALARRQRCRSTGRRVAHELLDDRMVVDVHGPLAG